MRCLAAVVGRLIKENADGTFDLIQGGIRDITPMQFPVLIQLGGVFRFEFAADEAEGLHRVTTSVSLNGVPLIVPDPVTPVLLNRTDPDQPSYLNSLLNLNLAIGEPGILRIVATVDGFGGSASVEVIIKPPPS